MNVLYCGDANIENGLIISVLSLLKNIKEELHIYVLTMNIQNEKREFKAVSDKIVNFLNQRIKKENKGNFIKKIDMTDIFKEELPTKNMETRFTPYCMLRLFVDKIEEIQGKILYLDTDVICRRDCTEFYNQDIEKHELVGVLDYYGRWFFKKNIFKFDYINSGVLLLNLDKIRETKLFEKCRILCKEKEMFMPDQSAINKIAIFKKIVPRKYNEQRKLHKNTIFQHFTTSFRLFPWFHAVTIKPWDIEKVHNELKIIEYDEILAEYETIIKEVRGNI